MNRYSAHEAKARFGQLLDAARIEPVTIEKHGRPVAVMLSTEAWEELQTLKLERLRMEVQKGIDAIERGDYIEVDEAGLTRLIEDIKARGHARMK